MPEISFFKNFSKIADLWPWKKEGEGVLGIDFGSSSVKLVELKKRKERAALMTYGELALGPYGGTEVGRVAKLVEAKAKEALWDLMKEASAKSKKAIVAVSARSSFVTVIEMPLMSEKEAAEAIQFEARRYIPVSLSEVILDWWIIPETFGAEIESGEDEGLGKKKKMMSVLLVAIHRDVIEKYRTFIRSAGVEIENFEIEIFSASRALVGSDLSPLILIDIGASSIKMTVVDYGIVRMVHVYDRGSQALTDSLSGAMSVDFARAEEMKRAVGLSSKPEHQELNSIIEPILDAFLAEAGRLMADYRRKSGRSVSRAILYGGGSLLKGLTDKTAERLGLEVSLGQPFGRLEYPLLVEPAAKEVGPAFATAIGLGLRGLK